MPGFQPGPWRGFGRVSAKKKRIKRKGVKERGWSGGTLFSLEEEVVGVGAGVPGRTIVPLWGGVWNADGAAVKTAG